MFSKISFLKNKDKGKININKKRCFEQKKKNMNFVKLLLSIFSIFAIASLIVCTRSSSSTKKTTIKSTPSKLTTLRTLFPSRTTKPTTKFTGKSTAKRSSFKRTSAKPTTKATSIATTKSN